MSCTLATGQLEQAEVGAPLTAILTTDGRRFVGADFE